MSLRHPSATNRYPLAVSIVVSTALRQCNQCSSPLHSFHSSLSLLLHSPAAAAAFGSCQSLLIIVVVTCFCRPFSFQICMSVSVFASIELPALRLPACIQCPSSFPVLRLAAPLRSLLVFSCNSPSFVCPLPSIFPSLYRSILHSPSSHSHALDCPSRSHSLSISLTCFNSQSIPFPNFQPNRFVSAIKRPSVFVQPHSQLAKCPALATTNLIRR